MSTSDSVDRVFVHALATVRRLPRTGSSRPPPSARLRLYGLYKQSMEGDVIAILARPTLPPLSPVLNETLSAVPTNANGENKNNNPNAVHRYASRDLRTREAQAEIEKWDAWHACAGMSKTDAKRRYISTLIETMKEYASGTQESRELVSELEFVWGQVQNQSQSGGSRSGSGSGGSRGNGNGNGDRESPRRSGIMKMDSFTEQDLPPGRARPGLGLNRNDTNETGMRVLSPLSARSIDDVVEGEEVQDQDQDQDRLDATPARHPNIPGNDPSWRTTIEEHLRRLSTEIAALREQLSSNHLLSSSSYSPYTYAQLSLRWKIWYKMSGWFRWLVWAAVRQACVNAVLLAMLIVWGRWRGDQRVEEWCRRRWTGVKGWVGRRDLRDWGRVLRLGSVST